MVWQKLHQFYKKKKTLKKFNDKQVNENGSRTERKFASQL